MGAAGTRRGRSCRSVTRSMFRLFPGDVIDFNRYTLHAMKEDGVRMECNDHWAAWAEVVTLAEAIKWAEEHEAAEHAA